MDKSKSKEINKKALKSSQGGLLPPPPSEIQLKTGTTLTSYPTGGSISVWF